MNSFLEPFVNLFIKSLFNWIILKANNSQKTQDLKSSLRGQGYTAYETEIMLRHFDVVRKGNRIHYKMPAFRPSVGVFLNLIRFYLNGSQTSSENKRVSTMPGHKLRHIFRLVYGFKFEEEVLDPIMADIYRELILAEAEKRPRWEIKFIHIRGIASLVCAAIFKSVLCTLDVLSKLKKIAK